MNPTEFDLLVPWYVNGTVDDVDRQRVERALADGTHAGEVSEVQELLAAMRTLYNRAPAPSSSVRDRVFDQIARAPQKRHFDWIRTRPLYQRAAGALMVVLIVAAVAPQLSRLPWAPNHAVFEPAIVNTDARNSVPIGSIQPKLKVDTVASAGASSGAGASRQQSAGASRRQSAPAAPGPLIARSGETSLIVTDVERSISLITDMARVRQGYVTNLQDDVPGQPGARHGARLVITVPASQFDGIASAVQKLGAVQSRSVTGEDVSKQIVDGDARLRNLRRTEADLLKLMDRSGRVSEILDVQREVSSVREQIEQLDATQKDLRQRVAYATLSVVLTDSGQITPVEPSARSQISDAWSNALRSAGAFTLGLVSAALYVVAFMPYIAVVAAGVLVWLRFGKR